MKKLWVQLSRIWKETRKFCSGITNTATHGTGVAVKTTAGVIATILSVVIMFAIVLVIGIVAVPYGAFGANRDTISEAPQEHCSYCGQTDQTLIQTETGTWFCQDCLSHESTKKN